MAKKATMDSIAAELAPKKKAAIRAPRKNATPAPSQDATVEPRKKGSQGEPKDGYKKMTFTLPEDWHKLLKLKAIDQDCNVSQVVEGALLESLGFPEGPG